MKLREANKDRNRRFHFLPEEKKIGLLLRGYAEVFPKGNSGIVGNFTPVDTSTLQPEGKTNQAENVKIIRTINNLNFLMTRFNMLNRPEYEENLKELALLRFEYMFLTGDLGYTQNPALVVDFFRRRDKPNLARLALRRMGEDAVDYEHLAERVIENPVFQENISEDTLKYKFRARLHALVKDEDYSKEQAAATLIDEGFDLATCDFNRWYASEQDFNIGIGKNAYVVSEKDSRWLNDFIAQRKGGTSLENKISETSTQEPFVPQDEEDPGEEYECSKEHIEKLDAAVKRTIFQKRGKTEQWIKSLKALTSDHNDLNFDRHNLVEAKMWDYLWGGQFIELARQLKGANPHGRTSSGLKDISVEVLVQRRQMRLSTT